MALNEHPPSPALAPVFFSIGVTTYMRKGLLRETLESIRTQTFGDFEVVVGNDDPTEPLSGAALGMEDARFRFVNHPRNLGEVGNMNALLALARGRYFTWMGDDDLYAPEFLGAVRAAITRYGEPACVLTAYETLNTDHGRTVHDRIRRCSGAVRLYDGPAFLGNYLAGSIRTIGAYGVFDAERLRRMGGMDRLSDAPVGLYGEYALLLRAGLLPSVVYIDRPLITYRHHGEAWATHALDTVECRRAGTNMIRLAGDLLSKGALAPDFQRNFTAVLNLTMAYLIKAAGRRGLRHALDLPSHRRFLHRAVQDLRGSSPFRLVLACVRRCSLWIVLPMAKEMLKRCAPPAAVPWLIGLRARFRRETPVGVRPVLPPARGERHSP